MKQSLRNLKNQVLKILSSLLLLFAMLPGVLAQESVNTEEIDLLITEPLKTDLPSPDKSIGFRLNVVGSDAMIHDLTIGRGPGAIISNSVVGSRALESNTTGRSNTAFGEQALRSNTTGEGNIAVGHAALVNNSQGNNNIGVGFIALRENLGHNNIAVGTATMLWNTTGYSNVAIGVRSLFRNTNRSNLVAVGDSALFNNGLYVTEDWHATHNTALGSKALYANTTGYGNTALGSQTLKSNTTGYNNTASGAYSLISNTTGYGNTAIGTQSLQFNTTGYYNTAIGNTVLIKNTYGDGNTGVGFYSLYDLTSGSSNTAIGLSAGDYRSSIDFGTFVGLGAYPSASGFSNITGIGYNVRPTASNQVRLGNSTVTSIGGQVTWTAFSDGGYKSNVEEDVAGLDFILKLRPVSYNLDVHRLASDLGEDVTRAEDGSKATAVPDEFTQKSRDDKAAIRYTGFVAQEVEATVNELGVAFSGVDAPVNKSGYYGLRYSDFVVPLVKAVQEQQAQIEALSPEGMDALRQEVRKLNEKNQQIELRNQLLEHKMDEILTLLRAMGYNHQVENLPEHHYLPQAGSARLEQNTPNPFHENTVIRYSLPEGTRRAQIIVTDMAGLQVMSLPLEHQGAGQVLIHGGTLPSGTYVYTLIVDGRKVDSKRMVQL